MKNLKNITGPMRLPFIILAPVCVILGAGTAYYRIGHISILYFILAVIGATTAHISVNAFNEYFDFKSGLDALTKRTPFSGGSGTLPESPNAARYALYTAIITFTITAAIGIYFLYVRGLAILPLGIFGLLIIFAYTKWITKNPLLCLIAPGMGFGILMVMGTDFVITGNYSITAFIASLVPFLLVNDLLLLNQFPDVEADKIVGRKHFPITIGRKKSSIIYGAFLLLTYLSIILGVILNYLPKASLLGLLTILIALPTAIGAYRNADNLPKLLPFMGLNVILNLSTPLLVAVGLFIK